MTVFTAAAAVLHADVNLSVPATYRQAGQGAGVTVRIIRNQASDLATPFGRQVRVTEGHTISVLAAVCTPARGDTWTLEDGTILTATDVDRSEEGASYTVTIR